MIPSQLAAPGGSLCWRAEEWRSYHPPVFLDARHHRVFCERYRLDPRRPDYRYSVPPATLRRLDGHYGLGRELTLFDADGRLLADSVPIERRVHEAGVCEALEQRFAACAGRIRAVDGEPILLASTPWPDNYYHFLFEAVPRLIDGQARLGRPDLRAAIPHTLPFQRQLLDLLGIDRAGLLPTWDGATRYATAFLPSRPSHSDAISAEVAALLRGRLLPAPSAATSPRRRLYVSRADSPSRPVVNEDAVMAALARLGFAAVRPGELTVAEQIRLFAEAEIVIGPHGAGLTNAVFCPPGALLVDLLPDRRVKFPYLFVANAAGLDYSFLLCPTDPEDFATEVPIELVLDLLARLFDWRARTGRPFETR